MKKTKKLKNDRILRIYVEVLGLEYLHYGLWLPEDEISFGNLINAQKRYEKYLIERIPKNSKKILDVGCGTGQMAKHLKELGYEVEGLSPDINQEKIFRRNVGAKFHLCRFEDFVPDIRYDCIIMSESAQYIPLQPLFEVAGQSLREGGHLMVSDYFVLDGASGPLSKSGHNLTQFAREAMRKSFRVVFDEDITADVTKTLDLAKQVSEKAILAADIFTEKTRRKHPYLTRLASFLFRNKIDLLRENMELLNSELFKKNKMYRFFIFQF